MEITIKLFALITFLLINLPSLFAKNGKLVNVIPGEHSFIYKNPYDEVEPSRVIHAVVDGRSFDILEVHDHFLKVSYYDPNEKEVYIGYVEREVVTEESINYSMGLVAPKKSIEPIKKNELSLPKALPIPAQSATVKLGRESYIYVNPADNAKLVNGFLFGDRKFAITGDAGKYLQITHLESTGKVVSGYILKDDVNENLIPKDLPRAPVYIDKRLTLVDVFPGSSTPNLTAPGVVYELSPRYDKKIIPYVTKNNQSLNLDLNRRNYFLYIEKVNGNKVTATITDELGSPISFPSGDNTVGVTMNLSDLDGFDIEKQVDVKEVLALAEQAIEQAKENTSSGNMCGFKKRSGGFTKTHDEILCTLKESGIYDEVGERNLQFLEATLHKAFTDYKMTDKTMRAHFYAQILHETGGLTSLIEKANFGCYRDAMENDPYSDKACVEYKSCADNDKNYFDNKYKASKDRYKARFRGRGVLQTTHCAGYLNFLAHYNAKKQKAAGSTNPNLDSILTRHDQPFLIPYTGKVKDKSGKLISKTLYKSPPMSYCSQDEIAAVREDFKKRYGLDIDPDGLMSINNGRENLNTIATPCENARVGSMNSKEFLVGTSMFYWSTKCAPKYKRDVKGKKIPPTSNSAIDTMTKCVNGGLTHYKERRKIFRGAEKCMQ